MSNPYLYDTGWKFDIARLKTDVFQILERYPIQDDIWQKNRISLVHEKGNPDPYHAGRQTYIASPRKILVPESSFTEFNDEFKNMYIYEVYQRMKELTNGNLGRMRIMRLLPGKAYGGWHTDTEDRYHIAITTNSQATICIKDPLFTANVPVDGSVWRLDTSVLHNAFNRGDTERYHIVTNARDPVL